MYQALYRKWRPRTFDDVVGQDKVTETLKSQVISGRLSHAYLFVGTRGTGKTTCAKILARAVNCEHPVNGNPCNKCKSCLGIEDGSIMDVVELDAASNNGVDNVRALRDEAVYSPAIVKKRVYIIDEVHMLSTSAFNALLKILEEPPEHLMFILATTELNKVPATILSRCQRYRFRRIDTDVIANRLRYVASQEQMQLESDAADLLAALADGGMRDGLSLLDQCSGTQPISVENIQFTLGLADKQSTAKLLSAISNGETENAVEIFENFWNEGKSPAALLSELCALLRDILIIKVAPNGGRGLLSAGYDRKTLDGFASGMTGEAIMEYIDSISDRIASLRDGRDPKIAAELCIVGLCQPDLGDSLNNLRTRVAKIEKAVSSGTVLPQAHTPVKAPVLKPTENTRAPEPVSSEQPTIKPSQEDAPPFDVNPSKQDIPVSGAENHSSDIEERPPLEEPPEIPVQPSSPAQSDCDVWTQIDAILKKSMPPFNYANLSDAQGVVENGELVISVTSGFKKSQLEKADVQEYIRSATAEVLGSPLPVRISERSASSGEGQDKLGELMKFGNVKCE